VTVEVAAVPPDVKDVWVVTVGVAGGDVTVKVSLPQMLFSEALFASPL
jgi:hypothetical protein